jgi:hypothetical protein
MEPKGKGRKLMLDCDICGEPVVLSPARYVELVQAGARPRCRKNGCERLCGVKTTGIARSAEVLETVAVGILRVEVPGKKRGRKNGSLAKLRVRRYQAWRYEDARGNG